MTDPGFLLGCLLAGILALTLAMFASAPFWGALADRWEQRRRTRALVRQVTAQEAALWVRARAEQQQADDAWAAIERACVDAARPFTAAQIDALETTEERA